MGSDTLICPRCFHPILERRGLRFCPHCGLADARDAASDTSPLDVTLEGRGYRVEDRLAIGSVCSVYRCRYGILPHRVEGVFKVARDPRANHLVANEADVLRHLRAADPGGRFTPFFPVVAASGLVGGGASEPGRRANVLEMHDAIRSPDELYTLAEVRAHYAAGLDARHVAWIWRRLLTVLGFAHASGVVHTAVLPMHVLVDPRDHKLLLVDWCGASYGGSTGAPENVTILAGGHVAWYKRQGGTRQPPTPALDIGLGARCMIELLGGDPLTADVPPGVDPAIKRYFQRCLGSGAGASPDAGKLLADFDQLIDALWGPRTFHVLEMPPKRK